MKLSVEPLSADSGHAVDFVATLVARTGSNDFYECVVDTLCQHGGYDCGEVMIFHRSRQPRPIASRIKMHGRKIAPEAYFDTYYREDPMYRAYLDGAPAGCYLLAGLQPDMGASTFFTEYYERTRIIDEIDFLIPVSQGPGGDMALVIWLGRHEHSQWQTPANHGALAALEPVLRAVVERHVALVGLDVGACYERALVSRKIDTAFATFASSIVSERECQVLRYTLRGYSAALTGERLGISEGTVKNHRKSIHRKLEINTQAELFSLFLQALPFAEIGLSVDPLALCEGVNLVPATLPN